MKYDSDICDDDDTSNDDKANICNDDEDNDNNNSDNDDSMNTDGGQNKNNNSYNTNEHLIKAKFPQTSQQRKLTQVSCIPNCNPETIRQLEPQRPEEEVPRVLVREGTTMTDIAGAWEVVGVFLC